MTFESNVSIFSPPVAQQPNLGPNRLSVEVSRSHTAAIFERLISASRMPLHTQHTQ